MCLGCQGQLLPGHPRGPIPDLFPACCLSRSRQAGLAAQAAFQRCLGQLLPDELDMYKDAFKHGGGDEALALPDPVVKAFRPCVDLGEDEALILMHHHRLFKYFDALPLRDKVLAIHYICNKFLPELQVPAGSLLTPSERRAYQAAVQRGVMRAIEQVSGLLSAGDVAAAEAAMADLLGASLAGSRTDRGTGMASVRGEQPDLLVSGGTMYAYLQQTWDRRARYEVVANEVAEELERMAASASEAGLPPEVLGELLAAYTNGAA